MKLVERFRTQSPETHPDAGVRLAHVGEIPMADREAIGRMAREDDDPRVRRAAVSKLMDPAALGAIAGQDASEAVRAAALMMLKDIALEAFEGVSEAESVAAVDAIDDPRVICQVAKSATRETTALRAVAKTTDPRLLGSIARHAAVEVARRHALDQLRERGVHAEIVATAMNSEHKDSALAAMDEVSDPGEIEQIAVRGVNKSAAKRARGIIREAEARLERERAEAAEALRQAAIVVELPAVPVPAEAPAADADVEAAPDEAAPPAVDPAEEERRLEAERAHAERRTQELEAARIRDEAAAEEARRRAEARAAEVAVRQGALAKLQQLAGRLESLAAKPDLSLKTTDRALADIRAALSSMPRLPRKEDQEEITRRLKAVQTTLGPKLHELKDSLEWQRWANATIQEQLCVKMEALGQLADPEAIATEIRSLQEQWRKVAEVPRAKAEQLWYRFKAAHDAVWPRCEAYFAARAEARAANLAQKTTLAERAEALSLSSDWVRTAEAIKQLQVEWKAVGPIPHGQEKALWERFRAACDRFFTRRREDLVQRRTVWSGNMAKKEALCAAAEALAESTDWDHAAAEVRRLQAEWKSTGAVKPSRSEAIWQRFRTACDRFFTRYADRHNLARAERVAAREAICAELEALASPDPDAEAPDALGAVRALRTRWQQEIAARGVDPDTAQALDLRCATALDAVVARWPAQFRGTDLDADANRLHLERLAKRMDELATALSGGATAVDAAMSPTTRLAAMLKEALASNTIGGKANEENRLRAALDEMRAAQAEWARVGFVTEDARRPLQARFDRACRQIADKTRSAGEHAKPGGHGPSGGSGRPPRPPARPFR